MSEAEARAIREEPRFRGIKQNRDGKTRASGPEDWDQEAAYRKHRDLCGEAMGRALRRAAKEVYGGILTGHRVFCPDLTCPSMVEAVIRKGGEPVFLDVSPEDWCMDPAVLKIAFEIYPEVKIVIMTHLHGFPGQVGTIKRLCEEHGALLIEDASESFGAFVDGRETGSFGDYVVRSGAEKDRIPFLKEIIEKKKRIYERYQERFSEELMSLNPVGEGTEPNFRRPCMTVESSIGFTETRTEQGYAYVPQHGTAAPMEIVEALLAFGVAAGPVRRPMHMRAAFGGCDQITLDGSRRAYDRKPHNSLFVRCNESADIFRKGICLPADVGMTGEEQDRVIDIILACYSRRELDRKVWTAGQVRRRG